MTAERKQNQTYITPVSRVRDIARKGIAPLRLVTAATLPELEPHASAWNCLALSAPERLPMLSYAYLRPFFEYQLERGESWRCMFVYEGERLVGVLPLITAPERGLGGILSRLHPPLNPHCVSVSFLLASGFEERVARYLLSELARTNPHYFSLTFERVHCDSRILGLPREVLDDVHIMKEPAGNGSYLPISGSFREYRESLSINFKRNLRKWDKRLSRLPDVRVQFLTGQDADSFTFEQFMQIEASGWKGRRGSAILSSPRRAEFYRALIQELREVGWLELHLLKTGEKLIAAHLGMRMERALVLWKIAYDEAFSNCGPGNILFEKTIERAFLSGDIDEINCLTDMEWHRHWKMDQRPYYNLYLYPRRSLPFVAGVIPRKTFKLLQGLPMLRPLLKSVRG